MVRHQVHHAIDTLVRRHGGHTVLHDFLHRHRPGCLAIARKCMNDFTFGNETKNCVLTRHHESANILCAEPVCRPLDAGFRSYCCDAGALPPQNAFDGHSLLPSSSLAADLISPPQLGGMPGTRCPLRGALAYHIGRKQSASIGDRATDQSLANWCVTGSGQDGLAMSALLPLYPRKPTFIVRGGM